MMLETNMNVVNTIQSRISIAIPQKIDTESVIDRIMDYFDSSSRVLGWVAAILTIIFVLAPVWLKILWPTP
jgi:hypothetical protein